MRAPVLPVPFTTVATLVGVSVAVTVTVAAPRVALGDANDLVLSRLADNQTVPGRVIPDNAGYRSLTSELGVALAPRLGTPADTIGWSGLELAADYSFSTISSDAPFWCATEESTGCTSKNGGSLGTLGVLVRKGISLPAPSFELTVGAAHLLESNMWTAQATGKVALLEGFHGWSIPSVALRFGLGRLFGATGLDLTTVSADLSISKQFAIADHIRLTPWAGWNVLWIVPRSGVIDKTPDIDATVDTDDLDNNFTFADQDTIVRQRLFLGARARYGALSLSFEAMFAFGGSTTDDREGNLSCTDAPANMKDRCDASDAADAQQTYTISLAATF
jgi:hypothetical protein